MRYYAIADLHGRHDLLSKALDAIHADAEGIKDITIITLGDYIDRGPESKQVIDSLMFAQQRGLDNLICLMGNHEAMMLETIIKPLAPDWWVGNGGGTTLQSYGWGGPPYSQYAYEVVPKAHLDWLQKLPLFYETEKHVFVHAGVPADDLDLKDQDEEQLTWMLYSKNDKGGYRGKHVVHGHHQFADGPHEWELRTDLDTFAWNTGRLVVGVFDDTQGKALRYIEVLGDDYGNQRQRIGSTYS